MAVFKKDFSVKTNHLIDLIDISGEVENCLRQSKIQNGVLTVFIPHTTASVIVNENESRLTEDIKAAVKDIISWDKPYAHNQIDHNAPAHILSSLLGSSASLIVENGKMILGTWQSIFLLELDGPRIRWVKVALVGE